MPLPTEMRKPTLSATTATTFIYGPPGVGKTEWLNALDPEHTLILAPEPGYKGIEAYVQPVNSWPEYAKTVHELKTEDHPFTTVGVDTVDMLAEHCSVYVMQKLGIKHPSDLEWGKGWEALNEEWRNRIAPLIAMGGVIFVGHSDTKEIKKPNEPLASTVEAPRLGPKGLRGFIEDTADFILFATFGENGERVLRTQPGPGHIAKTRGGIPLPDPMPLDGEHFKRELDKAIALRRKAE